MLDEKKWLEILGDNPHYPYEFAAGDDSSGIVYHRLDMGFVTKAYASQGAMACFMMASYLLKSQREGSVILPAVLAQIEQLNNDISAYAHRSFGHDPHLSHGV